MLLRMFSTDVAVREVQPLQAPKKQLPDGVPVQESKKLAGKLVRLLQLSQACRKVVPLEMLIDGKLVRLLQLVQAKAKLVPLEVSIKGKLVRFEQPCQVLVKESPREVSIKGKLVRLEQVCQVLVKLVTPAVTPKAASKLVILFAPNQAFWRLVPTSRSLTSATDVIWSSSVLLLKYGRYC